MRITLETIPHSRQRYESAGDWREDVSGNAHILVSAMGNDDYEFLVAIHELVEMWLCKKRGITDESVTAFDIAFEEKRQPGDLSEPGDDPAAPYQNEHGVATAVERLMCAALGLSWQEYERTVQGLSQ